jgi:predicted MFS family arabinose efflux permease
VAVAGLWREALPVAAAIVAAVVLLTGVFVVDRASRDRLFPSDAFRPDTAVGAALWIVLLMPMAQICISVYLPLFLQRLWGFGPTVAGSLTAVTALAWSGAAMIVAGFKGRAASQAMIRLGPVMVAAGLAGAAVAVPLQLQWMLVLSQVVIGSGFGVSWAFLSQTVMTHARPGEADVASGLVPTAQTAGYAIGAALAGVVAHGAGLSDALDAPMIMRASGWIFGSGATLATAAVVFGFALRLRHVPAS